MPPTDCVYAWNVLPGPLGLQARRGFQDWIGALGGGMEGAADNKVRTLIPFAGSVRTKNRLFAATSQGLWDVTSSRSSAPKGSDILLTFPVQSGMAGYGVSQVVVTGGGHFLLYADEANGLYVYRESTDEWVALVEEEPGAEVPLNHAYLEGLNPANVVHVAVFKGRVWLTERDTTKAYYLDTGAVFGPATEFNVGLQFRAGGTLVGAWNWTYDGGAGVDDSLVFLSSQGDVAIYQGTDPSTADAFALKGVWYVGGLVSGRRVATDYGGDVLILSRLGLVPLSRLVVSGTKEDANLYASAKISNLFAQLASTVGDLPGWAVYIHPTDNALIVTVPTVPGLTTEQLVMSFASRSWWRWRDLPILSACVWEGLLFFGTADGRVCRNVGWQDEVPRSGPPTGAEPVAWSLLTAYQSLSRPTVKQLQMIRPTVLSGTPNAVVDASARYNYELTEPLAPSGTGGGGMQAWDSAVWDVATWGPDYVPTAPIRGASGMGREVAIALRGNANTRTALVGIDLYFTEGGGL